MKSEHAPFPTFMGCAACGETGSQRPFSARNVNGSSCLIAQDVQDFKALALLRCRRAARHVLPSGFDHLLATCFARS